MRRTRPGEMPFEATTGRRAAAFASAVATVAAVASVTVTAALGAWSLPGAGSASADAGTLSAPAAVTGSSTPGSGAVTVSWSGVTAPDGGAVDGYVVERLQGATAGPACGSSTASPLPATPTSCTDTVTTAGTYTYRVTARFRTWSATSAASGGVNVVLDITPPSAYSLARASATPTSAASVSWTLTFSEPVTGVDASDIALTQAGGLSGASVTGVAGGPTVYTVTATSGGPAGTLGADLADDDSILDLAGNRLGGLGVGNGAIAGEAYTIDTTPPSAPALSLTGVIGNAYLTGTTAYVNTQAGKSGGFTVTAATNDAHSGIASVGFPSPAGFTGGGTDVSSPYSADYAWSGAAGASGAQAVVATNGVGLTSTSTFTVVADTTAPTGGTLTVNGGSGYATGSTVAVASTAFAEAQSATASGLALSTVTREYAALSGDACGPWSSITTVTSNGTDTGLVTGCYRYVLTGTDNVGNSASTAPVVVKVDQTAPVGPSLAVSGATAGVTFVNGTTVYARTGQAGQFTLTATTSDPDTGVLDVAFPSIGSVTGGGTDTSAPYATTYSWSGSFGAGGSQTVTARNLATGSSTASFALVGDGTAPAGGALSVNGGGAYSTTLTFPLAVTGFAETQTAAASGLASSLLTRQAATLTGDSCGAFGAPTTITPGATDTVPGNGCYLYTLTGTDNVGNVATLTATVKIDTTAPSVAAVALSAATGNTFVSGTIAYINAQAGKSGGFTVTASGTDAETGIGSAVFPSLSGFTSGGGTVAGATPATTYAWSGAAAAPGAGSQAAQVVNRAGSPTPAPFTVTVDTAAPTGGALTANGTAATAVGTQSVDTSGSVTLTRTDYGDAGAGIASSTLVRTEATLSAGTCGTFGTPTTLTGAPAQTGLTQGCYRYTLTGVDNVGNTAAILTTVQVSPALTITGASSGGGASKVRLAGTGVVGGGTVTIVECSVASAPCPAGNTVQTGTATVAADGTWSWTTGNNGTGPFYARATQGALTSTVFGPFTG